MSLSEHSIPGLRDGKKSDVETLVQVTEYTLYGKAGGITSR